MQLPDLSLLFMMALFWATYWVLRVTVFNPLGAVLTEREEKIGAAAAALKTTLEMEREALSEIDRRLTGARREALAERDRMRQEAGRARQAAVDDAREKARRNAADARARLDAEVETARAALRTESLSLATELATRALGRKLA